VVGTLDKVIGPAMLALLARAITEARFGRYVFRFAATERTRSRLPRRMVVM